jgi:hypothetical protein
MSDERLTIMDTGRDLYIVTPKTFVTLRPDGTVEFGADYQPDETARAFWLGLAERNPLQARIAALEDRAAEMQFSLDLAIADLQALRAAAQDALDGIATTQEETSITPECEVCSLCGWGITHHNPACSHAALAALLSEETP